MNNNCFTCFPSYSSSGNIYMTCVEGDVNKVVREFMHPTDDIRWTLWVFGAQIECFDKNNKNYIRELNIKNKIDKNQEIFFDKV